MNITKMILIGGVALVSTLAAPFAQARDRDRDHDRRDHRDRDRSEYRHHHHRHYHSGYSRRPTVVQRETYYSRPAPRTSVTIAVGGSRSDRHYRR